MDRRGDASGPPAGRIPRPFALRRRPMARPHRSDLPPVRGIRGFRGCAASGPLRSLRRIPSPLRGRALPLRLRGRRSGLDRRHEIRGSPLPGRRGGPPPPRGSRGPMEGPDPGHGSPDRGPGTGPPLEIFPTRVQPSRADRFPSFAAHRFPVRSAGALENPGADSPGAPSRIPAARKRRGGFPRSAGPRGFAGDPSARRRVHLRRHGGSVRPCLEKRRRGLYSGRDGRARRPLIPMRRTESRCPSRRSSPPRCNSAST